MVGVMVRVRVWVSPDPAYNYDYTALWAHYKYAHLKHTLKMHALGKVLLNK